MTDAERHIAFAVLGPVEVRVDGRPVALGGSRQRALLAALLLNANEIVPAERLIEQVWGVAPPATAPKMVQVYVSRLRDAIEGDPERNRILVTRPPGYILATARDDLDLTRFIDLVHAARDVRSTDPASAAARLRAALALWRGGALSDLASEPFAQAAMPRLEEMRLDALEDRIDADIAVGHGPDLVRELRDLVEANPLRERAQAFLMLALYRAGRQADALDVFTRARAALSMDLGIEPGPELQRLQAAVLRQEPWLDAPAASVRADAEAPSSDVTGVATASATSEASPHRRPRRRVRLATLTAAAALGVVLVAVLLVRPPSLPQPVVTSSNTVAVVDPAKDVIVDDIKVGAAPGPIITGEGSAWVGNVEDHTLTRIDMASGVSLKTYGLSSAPTSLAASSGIIWIGNGFAGTLSSVLAAYDQLTNPFFPGPSVSGLVAIAGAPHDLWVGLSDQTVLRLDPSNLRSRASLHLAVRARAIAVTENALWILDFGDRAVTRVDPVSGVSTASLTASGATVAILSAHGSIWVATAEENAILRIDPTSGRALATIPLTFAPTGMAADADAVWVVGGAKGNLARIDPNGEALVTNVVIGRPIGGIAVGGSRVWLTLD